MATSGKSLRERGRPHLERERERGMHLERERGFYQLTLLEVKVSQLNDQEELKMIHD